ncbi:hypothetical protein Landi51_12752 [Colletotrichum acutatum]
MWSFRLFFPPLVYTSTSTHLEARLHHSQLCKEKASIHFQMVIHLHPKSTSIAILLHPATLDPLLPKKKSVSKGTPESREAMPFREPPEHLGSRWSQILKHALPDHDATCRPCCPNPSALILIQVDDAQTFWPEAPR